MQWGYRPVKRGCSTLDSFVYNLLGDFIVCVTPLRDLAEVWIFQENEDRDFRHDDVDEGVEKNPRAGNVDIASTFPCVGDSGGGHWMQGGQHGTQSVLLGIQSVGSTMCGHMNPHSLMHSINNEDDLRWIKSYIIVNAN